MSKKDVANLISLMRVFTHVKTGEFKFTVAYLTGTYEIRMQKTPRGERLIIAATEKIPGFGISSTGQLELNTFAMVRTVFIDEMADGVLDSHHTMSKSQTKYSNDRKSRTEMQQRYFEVLTDIRAGIEFQFRTAAAGAHAPAILLALLLQ